MLLALVLLANNTTVASTGATSTVALVLTATNYVALVLTATDTIVASTGATCTVGLVLAPVFVAPVLLSTNTNVAS